MAAEIDDITVSNRALLEHVITDLHSVLEKLSAMGVVQARHDALLAEFRPLIDQYRSPLAAWVSHPRRARRNGDG
jgi:hypothetical protein